MMGVMTVARLIVRILGAHASGRSPMCATCPLGDLGPDRCRRANEVAAELQRQGWEDGS